MGFRGYLTDAEIRERGGTPRGDQSMAFKNRRQEEPPKEKQQSEKLSERNYRGGSEKKSSGGGYDGPILVAGLLDGNKAVAWGSTYREVEVDCDAGQFTIPKDVTFLVLNNKNGKSKNPYNLFIARKGLDKK
jgi:hypothetical protein